MTDVTRYRGDTIPDELAVQNPDGSVFDVAGCVFRMTLNRKKNPVDETEQIYQLDGVIVDESGGLVEFSPTIEQADQVGTFYYDIEMIDSVGRVKTLVLGKYTYIQDITKDI